MFVVLKWDGTKLPEEMRSLPAGRYVVEPVDDAPALTPEEEAGLEQALASLARGQGIEATEARARIESALRR